MRNIIKSISIATIIIFCAIKPSFCKNIIQKGNGIRLSKEVHFVDEKKERKKKRKKGRNEAKIKTLRDYDLPDQLHVAPQQLFKDLAAKMQIKSDTQSVENNPSSTASELLAFLNSNGAGLSNANEFDEMSKNNSPGSEILALMGLPTELDNLSVIQVVSKIGFSALLWGNPIVGAVGSAALSFAFSEARANQSDGAFRKKQEDEIYEALYKQKKFNNSGNLASNNMKFNGKGDKKNDIQLQEFQNMINKTIISQRSLKMLSTRLANLKIDEEFYTLEELFKVYQAVPVQSPLSKHCQLIASENKQRFTPTMPN